MLALLRSRRGVTLMELIVSIVVISLIMLAVTTVFGPFLQAFRRANSLAETNPIFDTISMLIQHDMQSAFGVAGIAPAAGVAVNGDYMTIRRVEHRVIYRLTQCGCNCGLDVIERSVSAPEADDPTFSPLFDCNFYRGKQVVFAWDWDKPNGIVTLTLDLDNLEINQAMAPRRYVFRPPGLAP